MHPTRALQLLMLASVAQASWFNFNKAEPRDGLIKRQSGTSAPAETTTTPAPSTSSSAPAVTTSSSAAAATTSTTSAAPTSSTPQPQPSVSASSPAASSTAPESSAAPTTMITSATPAGSNEQSTTGGPAASSSTTSTSVKRVTSTVKTVIVTTNSQGVATSFTSEAVVTSTPGLNEANSGDSSSGMSPETRKTVIGVVVGVGGAIVLGALGFVAWRIWGRKKQAEENDGLMEYNNQYGNEPKAEASPQATGRTPFQSTLESYHAPSHTVNASSNF